jgi:hypothetical protein
VLPGDSVRFRLPYAESTYFSRENAGLLNAAFFMPTADIVNKAITITSDVNPTAGDGTLVVSIEYQVVSLA